MLPRPSEEHHPDKCWPPSRNIDPDNCPVVYAVLMQMAYDGLDLEEALW